MCKICYSLTYPFTKLSNHDFKDTVVNGNVNLLNLLNKALVDLNNSNDYELEIEVTPCSFNDAKLYSQILNKQSSNDIDLIHFNTRSLIKNQIKIKDLFTECNKLTTIIAVTGTKLNDNSVNKVSFKNYNMMHKNSIINAGDAAQLVLKGIKYKIKNDLNLQLDHCEDVWIEIDSTKNKKKIIVAAMYRHTSSNINDFQISLKSKLEQIKNTEYYINGDINIDLLSSDRNTNVNKYLNMITIVVLDQ